MPGKSNRITIKRLMQMDVSVFFIYFVTVNQGLFLCICKPVKLCYNIMLYRANPARICPSCVRKERERQNILETRNF